jgi:hypothetical protein
MKTKIITSIGLLLLGFSIGFAQSPKNHCEAKPPYSKEYWCSIVTPESQSDFNTPFPFLQDPKSNSQTLISKEKFYLTLPVDQLEKGEKFKTTFRFKDSESTFSKGNW